MLNKAIKAKFLQVGQVICDGLLTIDEVSMTRDGEVRVRCGTCTQWFEANELVAVK